MADTVLPSGHDGTVDVTFKDDIAIIMMKCGENRFNELFIEKIHRALDEVLRNPRCRAVLTTGVGKFYSNGLDLPWANHIVRSEPDIVDKITRKFESLIFRILTFPLPTVALVNGHAFAAGAVMSLVHDHVIMQKPKGWWCLNEVFMKSLYIPSVRLLLRRKIPTSSYQDSVVLGRRFTGDEAECAGIVHEACAAQEMLPRALTWVKKVVPASGYDRYHLQSMKEACYEEVLGAERLLLSNL